MDPAWPIDTEDDTTILFIDDSSGELPIALINEALAVASIKAPHQLGILFLSMVQRPSFADHNNVQCTFVTGCQGLVGATLSPFTNETPIVPGSPLDVRSVMQFCLQRVLHIIALSAEIYGAPHVRTAMSTVVFFSQTALRQNIVSPFLVE
jgi:hypothetical protein